VPACLWLASSTSLRDSLNYSLAGSVSRGDVDGIVWAIHKGANPNAPDYPLYPPTRLFMLLGLTRRSNEYAPLYLATIWPYEWKGYVPTQNQGVLEALLNHGADPNASYSADPAVAIAARWGFAASTWMLLKHGAKPDARDCCGGTALEVAAELGHTQCVVALLAYGANVNADAGEPVYAAVRSGNTDTLRAVLGGHPNLSRPRIDQSLLELATERGNKDIIALLRSAGLRS
jgi:hypothetical protein